MSEEQAEVFRQHRTIGEQRFEEYLKAMQYPFEFERTHLGKNKRPDYTVTKDGTTALFDAKDFDPNLPPGFTQGDPYSHIRKRIEYGRAKFREYKEFCCCIVLQNNGNVFALTEHPKIVLGAMYGDIGYSIPVYVGPGAPPAPSPPIQEGFMSGAQMLPNKNTTISALITLRDVAVGRRRLRQIWNQQPGLSIPDAIEAATGQFGADFDAYETQQGVIVWENIYARIPLPRELFNGPFDQRWGLDGNDLAEVSCGSRLAELND